MTDPFFERLVRKHFPENTKNMVNEYLKENENLTTDSSVIFHVFNSFTETKFENNFETTWKRAIKKARLFFPIDEDVEKFVVASLLKFAIAKKEKGEDLYQKELSSAKKFMGYFNI